MEVALPVEMPPVYIQLLERQVHLDKVTQQNFTLLVFQEALTEHLLNQQQDYMFHQELHQDSDMHLKNLQKLVGLGEQLTQQEVAQLVTEQLDYIPFSELALHLELVLA
jgi:hypothetical protein